MRQESVDPAKKWCVAAGIFLEVLILIEASRFPEYKTVGIFALIAIFGKALPYCPPGLFLTMTAHFIDTRALNLEAKKAGNIMLPAL